jgi:hypothetical protein
MAGIKTQEKEQIFCLLRDEKFLYNRKKCGSVHLSRKYRGSNSILLSRKKRLYSPQYQGKICIHLSKAVFLPIEKNRRWSLSV